MAHTVLAQVIMLTCMMIVGYTLGKMKYFNKENTGFLSRILLDLFFPANILVSGSGDYGDGNFSQTVMVLVLYFLFLCLFTLIAEGVGRVMKLPEDEKLVLTRGVGYPNNGFIGIPLAGAVLGAAGTMYSALSVPGTTCYMFLILIQSFRRDKSKDLKKELKNLLTPLNISAVLMVIMIAFHLRLPGPVKSFLGSFANACTVTAMLVVGYLLSESPLLEVLKKPVLYISTFLRNIVSPLVGAYIFSLTGWNRTMCLALVMVLGSSVASSVGIMAARYDRAPAFAGQCMLHSSVLLPITMPMVMAVAERML